VQEGQPQGDVLHNGRHPNNGRRNWKDDNEDGKIMKVYNSGHVVLHVLLHSRLFDGLNQQIAQFLLIIITLLLIQKQSYQLRLSVLREDNMASLYGSDKETDNSPRVDVEVDLVLTAVSVAGSSSERLNNEKEKERHQLNSSHVENQYRVPALPLNLLGRRVLQIHHRIYERTC
jgi:hypothetical protein